MHKRRMQRIIAVLVLVVALALIGVGAYGISQRTSAQGTAMLAQMRTRAVLNTTGVGVVEALVTAAKRDVAAQIRESGGSMEELREASAQAEADVRASMADGVSIDFGAVDTTAADQAIAGMEAAVRAYADQEALDQAAFAEAKLAEIAEPTALIDGPSPELEALAEPDADFGGDDILDDMEVVAVTPQVDLSDFVATPEMEALWVAVEQRYADLREALKGVYPELDDASIDILQNDIIRLIYQSGDTYEDQFDRLAPFGGAAVGGSIWQARIYRYGDDLIAVGVGLIILGLLILFYQQLLHKLGFPRLIIGMFFVFLCVMMVIYDLPLTNWLNNVVVRVGMYGVLVLAMVPGIQCGIALNLGLPLGIIGGLVGGLLSIELGMVGWPAFLFAILVAIPIALVLGILYGLLLNRLKGSEMAVTTYVGYSVVSLMCIFWLVLPFTSPALRWPLGPGLRTTLTLANSFKHVLNNFLAFSIGGFSVPTGLLLFLALCCLLVWLFLRSKTGIAMSAVGNNPRYAEATGISVDRMRIIGTTLSTILGAVGILVYSQSYGFMQLYNAPKQMGFVAASAILIGGASITRAKISHVIIGTFLFQGVLTLGTPVANVVVPGGSLSEVLRILISNGIILYALAQRGGASRA